VREIVPEIFDTLKIDANTNKKIVNSFMMEGDLLNESKVGLFPSFRLGEKAEKIEFSEEKEKNKDKMKESFVFSRYKEDEKPGEKIKEELAIELKEEQENEAKVLKKQKEKDVDKEGQIEEEEGFYLYFSRKSFEYCIFEKKFEFLLEKKEEIEVFDRKKIVISINVKDSSERASEEKRESNPFSPLKKMPKNDKEKSIGL